MRREIQIGNIKIGASNRIAIQSMLSTPSENTAACIAQAKVLEAAGCDILRIAVPNETSVKTLSALKENVQMPIVADIHFDYKLALAAAEAGADKIRINPGNIGSQEKVRQVVNACKARKIPIRIGVNSGSLEKEILKKHGAPTAAALVESALRHVALLERFDFEDIVISIKSSNVKTMIDAFRLISQKCDYPLHIGVTEAGPGRRGVIKNAVGIGALLADGIGDTVRVSLTDDPQREIEAANDILSALDLLPDAPQLISCPTCGRTQIDLIQLANDVEQMLKFVHKPIKVAVMGCAVNGPGEAREADIGIAGGKNEGLIFKKGKILHKVPYDQLAQILYSEIEKL